MIGAIVRSFTTARLVRLRGILLDSYLPMIDTLGLVRQSTRNHHYVALIEHAEDAVVQGESITSAFENTTLVQPAMCEAAAALSDEDIAKVAAWYGSLPRYTHAASFMEDLAARGKAVHDRLCARCHLPPDDPDVQNALGIPLHGQRSDYLRYALASYLDGNREHLLPEMEEKVGELRDGDIDALINYYVSY